MDAALIASFWSHVQLADGDACWEWTAGYSGDGYGAFSVGDRVLRAHRVAWELANERPAGRLHVLHRCDNPRCVRPEHLTLGTHAANMADKAAKGRSSRAVPSSRTTPIQRVAIRKLAQSGMSANQIAQAFGITPALARAIARRDGQRVARADRSAMHGAA
jgi:hypothetical protein